LAPATTVPPEPATATTAPTQTATATSLPTQTAQPTPTHTAQPTHTSQPTRTPRPTHTTQPTRTAPVPQATPTSTTAPTPYVCNSLYQLANIPKLAPGQTFQCTIKEQELTDLANNYPDSPCSETRFTLDNGEIGVECWIRLRMQATLSTSIENCRIVVRVVKGTLGFKQIVQQMIATQFNVIRYDSLCMDEVVIDDGELVVSGYGR
jgi:hypothetical protein